MLLTIQLKRAYEKPARGDGFRILVDRLWPRGVKKEDIRLDAWAKTLAPSTELRKWFGHDPERWTEFRKRYRSELTQGHAARVIGDLLDAAENAKSITLVYGARDTERNGAVVLQNVFERVVRSRAGR